MSKKDLSIILKALYLAYPEKDADEVFERLLNTIF